MMRGVGVGGNVTFSMNGGRTEYNNWELDSGDNMDNGSNTTLNVYPSLDAIAEFKVLTSNYGAQYGRNGSGTVEVETKSGTKQLSWRCVRICPQRHFQRRQLFPQTTPAVLQEERFRIHHWRPGFYSRSLQQRQAEDFLLLVAGMARGAGPGQSGSVTVPSLAERGGNFSDQCSQRARVHSATALTIPTRGLPFPGTHRTRRYRELSGAGGANSRAHAGARIRWNASPTLPTNWREELFRVDHNFTNKVRGSFRYIHDSWNQLYPTPLWTNGTSFPTIQTNFGGPGVSMVARLTATLSPTLLNEFVASYTTDHIYTHSGGRLATASQHDVRLVPGRGPGQGAGDQSERAAIFTCFGEDVGYLPNGPYNSNPTYTYRDNVTKIIGKHNLAFGGYFVAAQKNELGAPGVATNGTLTFDTSNVNSTPATLLRTC